MNGSGGPQAQGRPVGLPPTVERPAIPIRAEYSAASRLTVFVLRPAWLWRREIIGVIGLASVGGWVWARSGRWAAFGALAVLIATCVGVPVLRRWFGRVLAAGRLRRGWDAACRFAGLATVNDRIPRIVKVWWVPAGELARVRIPKGATAEELADRAEHVAVCLRVREVRVTRDADRAHLAQVEVVRRDPFVVLGGASGAVAWPWVDRAWVDLWEPVPIGVDETGRTVTMRLPGRNVLWGGEPGAGKSAALSAVVAAGALDPTVRIWGLDPKRLELALWRPVLDRLVGNDIDAATDALADLQTIMDDRYADLEHTGRRNITPEDGPLYLVPIDELRFFTAHSDRKKRQTFNDLAIDLAARGRAAGIILAAATQKPSTDVVPSSLRDLLAYRWAMRCTTKDASDTILGAGWATAGFSAATIDTQTPGVGFLLAEGDTPRRVKSYYLTDDQIRAIAARGRALRDEYGDGRWERRDRSGRWAA